MSGKVNDLVCEVKGWIWDQFFLFHFFCGFFAWQCDGDACVGVQDEN